MGRGRGGREEKRGGRRGDGEDVVLELWRENVTSQPICGGVRMK